MTVASSVEFDLVYGRGTLRGRAEVSRALLFANNATFKDVEVDWANIKENKLYPFGLAPVLVERCSTATAEGDKKNEAVFFESLAIERYLAIKFGMHGANAREAAYIEGYRSSIEDALAKCYNYLWFSNTDEAKTKAREALVKELEHVVKFHERQLKDKYPNGAAGETHYVGDKTTIADIALDMLFHFAKEIGVADVLTAEKAPLLNKIVETVNKEPKLAPFRQYNEECLKEKAAKAAAATATATTSA